MDQNDKEIRRAFITCVPYFIVIFFLDDIDSFLYTIHSRLGNPLLVLYMVIATVIIIALLIHTIIDFPANYKTDKYKAIIPPVIYTIAVINSFWSPLRISSEIFHSKVIYQAYRKDQYGHTMMRIKENGTMSIRYPGPFGMADWEYGKCRVVGDTFYLNYEKGLDTADVKPDTLIRATDGLLVPIGIPKDTIELYKSQLFRMIVTKKKTKQGAKSP